LPQNEQIEFFKTKIAILMNSPDVTAINFVIFTVIARSGDEAVACLISNL